MTTDASTVPPSAAAIACFTAARPCATICWIEVQASSPSLRSCWAVGERFDAETLTASSLSADFSAVMMPAAMSSVAE